MDFEDTFGEKNLISNGQDASEHKSNEISQTINESENSNIIVSSQTNQNYQSFPPRERMETLYFPLLQNQEPPPFTTIITQKKFSKLKEKFNISGEIPIRNNSDHYNFEIIQVIGKGSRGIIYKAFDKISKNEYALKFLEFSSFSDKSYLNCTRELLILQILNKAFKNTLETSAFLKLFDFYYDDSENIAGRYYLVIVMEFCILDFNDILIKRRDFGEDFSENELYFILHGIISALSQLKTIGIAHRDIKLENILYNPQNGLLKLADFSEAKYFESIDQESISFNTLKGSEAYMSPELLRMYNKFKKQMKLFYDPWKADIYSIGLCIYVLYKKNRIVLLDREAINNELALWRKKAPADLPIIESFLLDLLEIDPKKRVSLEALELALNDHERVTRGKELFSQRNKDIVQLAFNQQISNDETFVESIKKMIATAEIYSRVFQTEKAIEKYHEIMQYLTSFIGLKQSYDGSEIEKEMLFFQGKVFDNLGSIYLRHLQNNAAMFNFKEAQGYLKKLEDFNRNDTKEEYEEVIFRNSLNMSLLLQNTFKYTEALEILDELEQKLKKKLIDILNQRDKLHLEETTKRKLRKIYMSFAELFDCKGSIFHSSKDQKNSKNFHQKAIYISEFLNDHELLQLKSIKTHLARVLISLNEYEEAIKILTNQIEFNKKKFIYENEDTIYCLNFLSKIYSGKPPWRDLEKAEALIQESLKISQQIYKSQNPQLSFSYSKLAKIHKLKKDMKKTEEFLLKAHNINKKNLGNEHFNLIETEKELASFYKENLQEEKALDIFQEIYGKFKNNRDYIEKKPYVYCDILTNLGELYLINEDAEKSYIVLNESLDILKAKRDKRHILEKTLILLCENLIENKSFDYRFRLKNIQKFYTQAKKLNERSGNLGYSLKLNKISIFLKRK